MFFSSAVDQKRFCPPRPVAAPSLFCVVSFPRLFKGQASPAAPPSCQPFLLHSQSTRSRLLFFISSETDFGILFPPLQDPPSSLPDPDQQILFCLPFSTPGTFDFFQTFMLRLLVHLACLERSISPSVLVRARSLFRTRNGIEF